MKKSQIICYLYAKTPLISTILSLLLSLSFYSCYYSTIITLITRHIDLLDDFFITQDTIWPSPILSWPSQLLWPLHRGDRSRRHFLPSFKLTLQPIQVAAEHSAL